MNSFIKTELITLLGQEFDKTVVSIANVQKLVDRSRSFTEKAKHVARQAQLEEYANTLYNLAQQILEA